MAEVKLPAMRHSADAQVADYEASRLHRLDDAALARWQAKYKPGDLAHRLAELEWQRRINRPVVWSALAGGIGGALIGGAIQAVLALLVASSPASGANTPISAATPASKAASAALPANK